MAGSVSVSAVEDAPRCSSTPGRSSASDNVPPWGVTARPEFDEPLNPLRPKSNVLGRQGPLSPQLRLIRSYRILQELVKGPPRCGWAWLMFPRRTMIFCVPNGCEGPDVLDMKPESVFLYVVAAVGFWIVVPLAWSLGLGWWLVTLDQIADVRSWEKFAEQTGGGNRGRHRSGRRRGSRRSDHVRADPVSAALRRSDGDLGHPCARARCEAHHATGQGQVGRLISVFLRTLLAAS